jgi:methionine-rich copper-binding protein CopC
MHRDAPPHRSIEGAIMRRLLFATFLAVTAAALPAMTLGHAEFVSSDPADGEVVDEPPAEVVITFEGELQPDGSEFRVAGPGGEVGVGSVDLEVAERNVLRGAVSITEPGIYTVNWTVVAEDGDEQTGAFSFTVAAGDVPETALPNLREPMRLALTLAGAALLLGAGTIVIRRHAA